MLDTFDASLLASAAHVRPSMGDVAMSDNVPLADGCGIGRHTSYFVFSTAFTGKGIPYPSLSRIHSDDGVGRRRIADRGVVGKSDHAKTESECERRRVTSGPRRTERRKSTGVAQRWAKRYRKTSMQCQKSACENRMSNKEADTRGRVKYDPNNRYSDVCFRPESGVA